MAPLESKFKNRLSYLGESHFFHQDIFFHLIGTKMELQRELSNGSRNDSPVRTISPLGFFSV